MCCARVLSGGRWTVRSVAWQAENWSGARYCKRNFLMKERKLFLSLWLFAIKWLILYGCEQAELSSLPQRPLPWPAHRQQFVSGHRALKSGSEINFLLLQWFNYYVKMPLQSSCFVFANCTALEKGLHGQNKRPKWTPVLGLCFCFCLIPSLCSFSSTHCDFEPRSSVTFATSTTMVLKLL